jgi:hypothetical protein
MFRRPVSFRSGIEICDWHVQYEFGVRGVWKYELAIVAVGLAVQLVEHVCHLTMSVWKSVKQR